MPPYRTSRNQKIKKIKVQKNKRQEESSPKRLLLLLIFPFGELTRFDPLIQLIQGLAYPVTFSAGNGMQPPFIAKMADPPSFKKHPKSS
jgi:hypothetical protein